MALGTEAQREWLRQWSEAAVALAAQRRRFLERLSESEALAASDALLALVTTVTLNSSRRAWSGLVNQQALFHRRPPQ